MDSNDKTVVAVVGLIAMVIIAIAVCVTAVHVSEFKQEVKMAELGFTPEDITYSHTWKRLEESE